MHILYLNYSATEVAFLFVPTGKSVMGRWVRLVMLTTGNCSVSLLASDWMSGWALSNWNAASNTHRHREGSYDGWPSVALFDAMMMERRIVSEHAAKTPLPLLLLLGLGGRHRRRRRKLQLEAVRSGRESRMNEPQYVSQSVKCLSLKEESNSRHRSGSGFHTAAKEVPVDYLGLRHWRWLARQVGREKYCSCSSLLQAHKLNQRASSFHSAYDYRLTDAAQTSSWTWFPSKMERDTGRKRCMEKRWRWLKDSAIDAHVPDILQKQKLQLL